MLDKRKMLRRLDQKVCGQEPVFKPHRSQRAHHRRRGQTSPVQVHRRNVVSPTFSQKGKRTVRQADGTAGKRGWRKRRPPVTRRIGVNAPRESGQTSIWCLDTKTTEESVQRVLHISVALCHWCSLPRKGIDFRPVSCSQHVFHADGSFTRPLRCLSGVR